MNSTPANRQPRERQTIRCCGHLYARWRYKGAHKFHGGFHRQCVDCGGLLLWRPYRATTNRASSLEHYHRTAEDNFARGLTCEGQPRRRVLLTREERLKRARLRWHANAEARTKAGLTTRGTIRRRQPAYNYELVKRQLGIAA